MGSLEINSHTMSQETHERNLEFEDNYSTDIGKSQQLWKEGHAKINMVSAMRPRLAKMIDKV